MMQKISLAVCKNYLTLPVKANGCQYRPGITYWNPSKRKRLLPEILKLGVVIRYNFAFPSFVAGVSNKGLFVCIS